jgi:alkaline phosphatase
MTVFRNFFFITIAIVYFLSCSNNTDNYKIVEEKNELADTVMECETDTILTVVEDSKKLPNIILLIGDGMGLSQISSSFYFGDETPNFRRFTEIGLMGTSSASHKITDSGASGTAIATGVKTYNGAIGVNQQKEAVKNTTEFLSPYGYKTGVISTSAITHATPASFYAHVDQRSKQDTIAYQLAYSEIDFFAGGGRSYFATEIEGESNYSHLEKQGFIVNSDTLDCYGSFVDSLKYGFIMADGGMPKMTENREQFLPQASELALEYFSKSEAPFFMMIEGSQIDWAGHDNDTDYMIQEVLDFDQVIGLALDFAEKDSNTLVIVTADHETGGFCLSAQGAYGSSNYNIIDPSFASDGHSASLIPVFAKGPYEGLFDGFYENADIFHKITQLVDECSK